MTAPEAPRQDSARLVEIREALDAGHAIDFCLDLDDLRWLLDRVESGAPAQGAPAPLRASWPVPDEAIVAFLAAMSGERRCKRTREWCFRPAGHDGACGLYGGDKDEWIRYAIGDVAPHIVVATLRQAAARYVAEEQRAVALALTAFGDHANLGQTYDADRRTAAAAAVAQRLNEWADEVRP